jgi:hypothetical protein
MKQYNYLVGKGLLFIAITFFVLAFLGKSFLLTVFSVLGGFGLLFLLIAGVFMALGFLIQRRGGSYRSRNNTSSQPPRFRRFNTFL